MNEAKKARVEAVRLLWAGTAIQHIVVHGIFDIKKNLIMDSFLTEEAKLLLGNYPWFPKSYMPNKGRGLANVNNKFFDDLYILGMEGIQRKVIENQIQYLPHRVKVDEDTKHRHRGFVNMDHFPMFREYEKIYWDKQIKQKFRFRSLASDENDPLQQLYNKVLEALEAQTHQNLIPFKKKTEE